MKRSLTRWGIPALIAATALLLLTQPATAAPPEDPAWGELTMEGPPAAAGFISDDHLVYATGDAGSTDVADGGDAACTIENGDADLFLMSWPNGTGCLQALETSDSELGREGVRALTTAPALGRVVVALAPASTGGLGNPGPGLRAWDLGDDELTQAWTAGTGGSVLQLDTDPAGTRTLITVDQGTSFAVRVYDAVGERTGEAQLPGNPRTLSVSDNARFAAVGGNVTRGNASFGWIQVFDLTDGEPTPIIEEEIERARTGIVASLAITDEAITYAGTAGGTLFLFEQDRSPRDLSVGNGTVHVDASRDGSVITAAVGDRVTRVALEDDGLRGQWTRSINGSATSIALRGPYIHVTADTLNALSTDGQRLWETTRAQLVATNRTGLGIALADPQGGTTGGPELSSLTGAVVFGALEAIQPNEATPVSPGDVGIANVTLRNTGAAILAIDVDAQAPRGVTITPAESLVLRPGENRTVPLTIEVERTVSPGDRDIPVRFVTQPKTNASIQLAIDVGIATDIRISLEPGTVADQSVIQGQNITVRTLVRNLGNAETRVTLEAQQILSQGENWPLTLEPSGTITVEPGTVRTVRIDVQVPNQAANGTQNRVLLRGITQAGAAAASFDLTVNPFEILDLSPQIRTKTVAPGGVATYAFSVANLGSVATNVTLDAQALDENGEPYVPQRWGLVFDRTNATIPAGDAASLNLEIAAPSNATDAESLRVRILAVSEGGATDTSLAFAVVDMTLASDPEEPKREPLGPLVALTAMALASLALKRRDHDKL